jgi:hypothetical protein
MEFDHIGLRTFEKKDEEDWVEATRVWVTNPKKHPFNVEWLRYEDDSPVEKSFQERPHVAYRVDNLEEASKGMKVLLAPFEVGGFTKVGFFEYSDGTVIEFMQYLGDKDKWFNK